MNSLFSLTFCQLWRQKKRLISAILAIIVCVGFVIYLFGEYDKMMSNFDDDAQAYLGEYHAIITLPSARGENSEKKSKKNPLEKIKDNSEILRGDFFMMTSAIITPKDKGVDQRIILASDMGKPRDMNYPQRHRIGLPNKSPHLVALDVASSPFPLVKGRWFLAEDEGVLGSAAAEEMKIGIDDFVNVFCNNRTISVKVVGLVSQVRSSPVIARSGNVSTASLFVNSQTSKKWTDRFEANGIYVVAKNPKSLSEIKGFSIFTAKEIQNILNSDRYVMRAKGAAWIAMGMVILCTCLIIFTTLNIGVIARTRQTAILRAMGLRRKQAALMLFYEAILLVIPGWFLGVILGQIILINQGFVSFRGLFWSGFAAILGSILAAIVPAVKAMKISPMDVIKQVHSHYVHSWRFLFGWAILGLLFLLGNLTIVYLPNIELQRRIMLQGSLGTILTVAGFFCLIPLIIRIFEIIFVKPLSRFFGFQQNLLSLQLSGHLWQSVATIIALSAGLGLFLSTQIWGYTMVVPFLPQENVTPQTMAIFMPAGISRNLAEKVQDISGSNATDFLALEVEQPKFTPQMKLKMPSVNNDNALLVGLDLEKSFLQKKPLLNLTFLQGDLPSAIEMLKNERACLIPDSFQVQGNLRIGDDIEFLHPRKKNIIIKYKIAGVVHIPGWHWLTKTSGIRRQGGFTAGMLLADAEKVRKDFNLENITAFWFNSPENKKNEDLESNLQNLALTQIGVKVELPNGIWQKQEQPYVKVSSLQNTQKNVSSLADKTIWSMSKIPLVIFALMSLALLNTLLGNALSRQRQWGIMRSCGMSGNMLKRLVIAEAIMISLITATVSLFFAIFSTHCVISFYRYAYHFGGVMPSIKIPLEGSLVGGGILLLMTISVAFFVALKTCGSTPLSLLQKTSAE